MNHFVTSCLGAGPLSFLSTMRPLTLVLLLVVVLSPIHGNGRKARPAVGYADIENVKS